MNNAYTAGIPANGGSVPDGETGGWGYAKLTDDEASGCGYTCHTRVKARDFVFTSYARR